MNNRLIARVNAKNRANTIAAQIEKEIREIFRPYVGKKIFLNGGDLIAPLRGKLEQYTFPHQKQYRFYRLRHLKYILSFEVGISEQIQGNSGCASAKSIAHIGTLDGGVILETISPDIYNFQQYTPEEIETLRDEAFKKESELRAIQSKFACFGVDDYAEVGA